MPSREVKKSKAVIYIFLGFALIFGLIAIKKTFSSSSQANSNNQPQNSLIQFPKIGKMSPSDLVNKNLQEYLSQQQGTYALYIYDINKNEGYGLREKTVMTAASTNKVPILACLYYYAGKEEIDLEKIIVTQPSDIQDYGTGSIRYESPGKPYSLKTLARLMMEKSDNTAAYILANQVLGTEKIQSLMDIWDLKQTDIANNKSSPFDLALLLLKMYKGEVTTQALSMEMLNFMTHSDFEDRIPAGVPKDVKVYHKTGDEVGKIHDIAIIEKSSHPYILTIFSSDITDESQAKKVEAEISKRVFEAF